MYGTGVVLALGEQYVRLFVVLCMRLNWVVLLVIDAVYEVVISPSYTLCTMAMTGLR